MQALANGERHPLAQSRHTMIMPSEFGDQIRHALSDAMTPAGTSKWRLAFERSPLAFGRHARSGTGRLELRNHLRRSEAQLLRKARRSLREISIELSCSVAWVKRVLQAPRCSQKRAARRSKSRQLPATRSRRSTTFLSDILRARVALPNRRFSISRTHREQSLQTNCKPSRHPRQTRKGNSDV
jgi:hypothetical protein